MKHILKDLISKALTNLQQQGKLHLQQQPQIQLEYTRDKKFGDFACNIALIVAKQINTNPRELAGQLVAAIPSTNQIIDKIDIAGPGFINFYLTSTARHAIIATILNLGGHFGRSDLGKGININFEFVSANPTGPLHVGHGRSVAYGAACADLLEAVGYDVHREYYVNDAGRQMDILATSVWLRYLELYNESFLFPINAYKGEYVIDIAKNLQSIHKDSLQRPAKLVFADLPPDLTEDGQGDKEAHIDGLIARAKSLLGEERYQDVFNLALDTILDDIRDDVSGFGIQYQEWFSERSLYKTNAVSKYIEALKAKGHTYERDGNLWFRATDFNDDKDRVLIRQNGQPTYFAADIAYHSEKFKRGADKLILVLGADHHGYVTRIKAALQALGIDPNQMDIIIVQFATLFRGHEKVQMSTRSGSFVTLRELREEVGKDAARFFYVQRKSEQHLEFDLDLAKSQSADNPVYYIQYAHARIASVFRQCTEKHLPWDKEAGLANINLLLEPQELTLIDKLSRYPEVIANAAENYEPHIIAHYLRELAQDFHTYYNALAFIVDDSYLRNARLCLIAAVAQTMVNGLTILGVSAPDTM